MAKKEPERVCSDCIHFHACQSWTSGILDNTDARPCRNYETVEDSAVYYLGYKAGFKDGSRPKKRCDNCANHNCAWRHEPDDSGEECKYWKEE